MHTKSLRLFIIALFMFNFQSAAFAEEEAVEDKVPSYVSLGKPMVLNLSTEGKRLTFLQVGADVLVKDEDAKEIIETHIPAIRHQIIVMLSEQKAIDMKKPAKREEVRLQVTEKVQKMIEELADNTDVDEILFTSFLVQ